MAELAKARIGTYLRNTLSMSSHRLRNLVIMSTEDGCASNLDFDAFVDEFVLQFHGNRRIKLL